MPKSAHMTPEHLRDGIDRVAGFVINQARNTILSKGAGARRMAQLKAHTMLDGASLLAFALTLDCQEFQVAEWTKAAHRRLDDMTSIPAGLKD